MHVVFASKEKNILKRMELELGLEECVGFW